MWKKLVEYILNAINLARDTKRNAEELEALKRDMRNLYQLVVQLYWELETQKKQSALERENLRLQVENMLLRYQQALPPEGKKPEQE